MGPHGCDDTKREIGHDEAEDCERAGDQTRRGGLTSMTLTVADHYEKHLGPIYTRMVGDVDAAISRSDAELDALPLPSTSGGTAVDLGAGFGLHSLPLARRGFSVVAIDSYEPLLKELVSRKGSLPISTVNADLLAFRAHTPKPVDVIVCMGDTLTHLPNHSAVELLFRDVAASLRPGGLFAATFRDYVSSPLQGDARFKLRLSPEWVVEHLSSLGLTTRCDAGPGGMIRITARMPGPTGAAEAFP